MPQVDRFESVPPIEVLRANLLDVPQKDREFAKSLLASWDKYNRLSSKQEYWVIKLAAEASGILKRPEMAKESVGSFQPVMELFAKAKQNLKYPKIKLDTGGQEVQLSIAGPASKAPGTVNVTDGKPFGMNKWFGRVTPDGVWEQNPRFSEETMNPVRRILQALSQDPTGTARKYALLTGNCSFCGMPLTDPKSTSAGFGPVCAKNWGLLDQWNKAAKVIQ